MRDINFVIKTISKQKNVEEETVRKLLKFYWERTREMINSGEHTNVYVRNLGMFAPKYFYVRLQISRLIKKIRRSNVSPATREKAYNELRKFLKIRSQVSKIYFDGNLKKGLGRKRSYTRGYKK